MADLTLENAKRLAADPTVRQCVNTYLLAKAYTATMREAVAPIHREAMERWKPTATLNGRPGEIITSIDRLYLCEDEHTCRMIYADCDEGYKAAGLSVSAPGNCPALEAEDLERKAAKVLVEACAPYLPGFTWDRLCCHFKGGVWGVDAFTDLITRMVVNSSGYTPPQLARTA